MNIEELKEMWLLWNRTLYYKWRPDIECLRCVLDGKELKILPLNSELVYGSFYCQDNNLTSCEGCPTVVYNFYCHNNQLTLEGGPNAVKDSYFMSYQQLAFIKTLS
jgi:hypothetical protein